MNDNRLKPLGDVITIKYKIIDHPEYGEKTGHFITYEDFGVWLCSHFKMIEIGYISDR